ncbi:protein-glutamate methylesterase/protein-glutamine glutaminase [Psychromonas sp. Urea-02u-13]|uniref:protein-glutamate methylesterase/protein-glutamine glutaminase n=1 Tax=Psychromonas sp. Urea-02u-13 TaxID=2058326 RepID=UPI000C3460D4|nr:chemotaxis response regulator protein-glutamate methylesterase [Psychromonas sp. Urea-02u-13]PKG38379.1 chemotaxis response regulator protein-glutamate methylesterase [Psychromonas sp. Urea-02u-13]
MTIKVLIVDDSALIRRILTEVIDAQVDMEVVGSAPDPLIARTMIKSLNPDVLTLDVEMPKMNGLDFLEKLMKLRPMPVLMISTLTDKSSAVTIQALSLGAVDFITKPKMDQMQEMRAYGELIADKIRAASVAKIKQVKVVSNIPRAEKRARIGNSVISAQKVIAVGASTGGTEAINHFLLSMPEDCPPIVITQHMPAGFTASFAARLNNNCVIQVKEATHNELIKPGCAYIAPGANHMLLSKRGDNYYTQLNQEEPVNRHRPSVDVLFDSVAICVGKQAVGVILTGMGKDGALGMLKMKQAGAFNFGQDEESCIVYGMPKEAVKVGGVDQVVALDKITSAVLKQLTK